MSYSAYGLAEHGDQEKIGPNTGYFDTGANGCEESTKQHGQAESLAVEKKHGGKDERNVAEHVDHGEPVDGVVLSRGVLGQTLIVEDDDDILNDAISDPVKGVQTGYETKGEENDPATKVDLYFVGIS